MPVYYNNNKIIPAPFASIKKISVLSGDGSQVDSKYQISLKSKLMAYKGSPMSSGAFWNTTGYPPDETIDADYRLKSILAKQTAIANLFSQPGTLEIQPWDGSSPKKFNCRAGTISFEEGNWFEYSNYVIDLEGESQSDTYNYVDESSEEWNIESADEHQRTFRLTHSVNAKGRQYMTTSGTFTAGWKAAEGYVLSNLGLGIELDRMQASGVLDATSLSAYNYVRSNSINKMNGQYGVTETWLCYNPNGGQAGVEEFTVNSVTEENGLSRVSVEGNIQGLQISDNTNYTISSTRYTNALAKWNSDVSPNVYTRAGSFSGKTLNTVPLKQQVGYNENNGIINYSYEYDDRPTPETAGALSESVTINSQNQADVFAIVPVLGRAIGPVLQDISTKTQKKRTINVEVVMPCKRQGYSPSEPDVSTIINSNTPIGTQIFRDEDQVSWSPITGRYARTVGFTWE